MPAFPTLDVQQANASGAPFLAFFDYFTQLYQDDTGKWTIGPQLALSWQAEAKSYTLKLRQGVKFHDGSPWNAEAAKWNIDRMRTHPKSLAKELLIAVDSVDIVDDSTIRLNLKGPSASLPTLLSHGGSLGYTGIVSKAAVDKNGDDWLGSNPVGTGPWKFVEWKRDQSIAATRFDGFWEEGADGQKLPYLDSIAFRQFPDANVGALELRAGTTDIVSLFQPDVPTISANPDLSLWEPPGMAAFIILGLNARKGPFADNKDLRLAVAYGLDREAMVKVLAMGRGMPACYYWSPGQVGYDPSLPCYKYDPAKAKEYLAKAGYPNGLDARIITFSAPDRMKWAEMIKSQLDTLGFRITIDAAERLAWIAKAQVFDFDLAVWNRTHQPDPDGLSRDLISSAPGAYSGWQNPKMDECMLEGRTTLDPQKRNEVYRRCQQLIYDDAYNILTWEDFRNVAFSKKLRGLRMSWNQWDPRYIWLEK